MKNSPIISRIDQIKEMITRYGKLTNEQLQKINHKFRLEWNYHSNSMEGNTLTIEETRSVMVGNVLIQEKPFKDVAEMKGHDAVIAAILNIGKGELRLSEKRIKEIHTSIMYEEDPEKKSKIGVWKKENNEIYNTKGEKYTFVDWALVPEKMHDLLNRTNAAIDAIQSNKKHAPHPIEVALAFHLEYLDIHPFYDGNGRTARILTNLILISLGYTPFWITKSERAIYYNYVSDIQSYGGDKAAFYQFITGLIERSEQLVLSVLEGKEIEDEDDIDKEIELLKRELKAREGEVVSKSFQVIKELYENSLRKLFIHVIDKTKKFDDFFLEKEIQSTTQSIGSWSEGITSLDTYFTTDQVLDTSSVFLDEYKPKHVECLGLHIVFKGFKHNGTHTFNHSFGIWVLFSDYFYIIDIKNRIDENACLYKKLYSEPLTDKEISGLVTQLKKKLLEDIKTNLKT